MNRDQIAQEFHEAAPGEIYLNWGSVSRAPRTVIEAADRARRVFEVNPTASLFGAWAEMRRVQTVVADFLGASPQDLFLRPNVTYAMNAFLLGVKLPPGGEVLTTNLEYGAITNILRLRCEREGRKLRALKLPHRFDSLQPLTEDELLNQIVKGLSEDTRLLMISHVMTANGLVIPIERLSQETRRRGIVLAVDGAHGAGAVKLELNRLSDLDFYGGNFHKWLMGPKGAGFGWVAPWRQKDVEPIEAGWTTFETPWAFEGFFSESPFAMRMLSSSTLDFSAYGALPAMIEFWEKHGREELFRLRLEAQTELETMIEDKLGWQRLGPNAPELRGPLTAYGIPTRSGEKVRSAGPSLLVKVRKDIGVQIASPLLSDRVVIRLSPGVSTTSEQISAAIDRFSEFFH